MRQRSKITLAGLAVLALGATGAMAVELKDMIGRWKWTDYTVEVKECTTNPSGAGFCATVVDGPKNKGMEMMRSKLEKKGEAIVGKVAHPATGDIYDTKMTYDGKDKWTMDGCTEKGVCAKGDFVRVK
ncbi:MAG TPA: DUF2147 domain-containing protein [Hyphomicrobiaceae bacterium]|nr:DUF2147 domain-containing protein [Hyphomicrobiaceae bacterium]